MSAPTTDRIGAATVAEIREMLGGLAGNTDRALLVRVNRWGREHGWEIAPYGTRRAKGGRIQVAWDRATREVGVVRKGFHQYDWYPITSVREAIDILVIESVLPVEFSSMYAAGRADRAVGGAA